jgi:hypothetical protein
MFARRAVLLLLTMTLGCASQPAAPTGTVTGVAVDGSGHGLPGITVTIQTPAGKAIDTVVTSADGSYVFPSVPAGQYQVLTLLQGFSTPSPLSASVLAGQSTQLKPLLLLPPGYSSDPPPIVNVTATPTPR